MLIREANAADIPTMAEMRTAAGWTGGAGPDVMARYLAGTHHPQHALRPRAVLVASDGQALVGFIAGHLTHRFGCTGELQWLFVAPHRRGMAVGDALFEQLASWFVAHDARRICVNVEPMNTAAREFYARHGAVALSEYWMVWEWMPGAFQPAAAVGEPAG